VSVAAVREQIARFYRGVLNGVSVVEHGGPFNAEELKRVGASAPAVIVTCLGVSGFSVQGTEVVGNAQWAAFIVTRGDARERRDAQALRLCEAVAVEAPFQVWDGSALKAPTDLNATNLYSSAIDALGLSLWAVRWSQLVQLDRNIEIDSDDLNTVHNEYEITAGTANDEPPLEDEAHLEGP
jgi:hypothetical protein